MTERAHPPAETLGSIAKEGRDGNTFVIERTKIVPACAALKDAGYEHLSLITAIDWQDRWEVLYHLVRFGTRDIVTLRVTLPYDSPEVPSVSSVWPGAVWHERETYDLMGIRFIGNPDLRRILLPEEYEGFPLRKEVRFGNRS